MPPTPLPAQIARWHAQESYGSTLAAVAVASVLVAAGPANAGQQVLLGFGETYRAPDGSSCTHRGVDAAMAEGDSVCAPIGGTVRFAGRVPGPHGGTVRADLETVEGRSHFCPCAISGEWAEVAGWRSASSRDR
jgi:murein DD-endopeptidase MepM/ murein hydrolase activator NlpD